MPATARAKRKKKDITLFDRLSQLHYVQACQLLGPDGAALIRASACFAIDIDADVRRTPDCFTLRLPLGNPVEVEIRLGGPSDKPLLLRCSACADACEHMGAALSLILEEKLALQLAREPDDRVPLEHLSPAEVHARVLAEREERAKNERMRLRSSDPENPWVDYQVTSLESGRSYRVALRGDEAGISYCSCPDFRKNRLGTCKHIMHGLAKVKRRFPAAKLRRKPYRKETSVHLRYGEELELRIALPTRPDPAVSKALGKFAQKPIDDLQALVRSVGKLEAAGHEVVVYPDAAEYLDKELLRQRLSTRAEEMKKSPESHPLRRSLLQAELRPHQVEGIAFAARAGRAILADDMGLGKTIQAIGTAELLAREAGITRVLVISPASLKHQWASEIERFSGRSKQIVLGGAEERGAQYASDCFFTICNYEQVLRDIGFVEAQAWDFIVLDEGQRIKNWEAKTSRVIKGLRSPFALVLSGTPLENRLEELYSIVEFIDDRRLPPAYRFYHRHRVVDEGGKVVGYRNLDELRQRIEPILLRRTRQNVLRDLPPCSVETLRIAPTEEQVDIHKGQMQIVQSIARKRYISEMDLLRLRKALLMCRLAADSSYLVEKEPPGYSSKLDAFEELVGELLADPGRKIAVFSEWTTMLDLVEERLEEFGVDYARLDGNVPQKKRAALVRRFNQDPDCRLFLATNAGSTGLNLQAANTVINVDLPWNPAILDQRIARAHRMGQKEPVQVFVLVTEGTIEESMLATLGAKKDLALAALSPNSEVSSVDMSCGIEELKRRLEVLLGNTSAAPIDESQRRQVEAQVLGPADPRFAEVGGQLVSTAFELLAHLVDSRPDQGSSSVDRTQQLVRKQLAACTGKDAQGRPTLALTLPSEEALDRIAATLAGLVGAQADQEIQR